jgi:hypothetical protein
MAILERRNQWWERERREASRRMAMLERRGGTCGGNESGRNHPGEWLCWKGGEEPVVGTRAEGSLLENVSIGIDEQVGINHEKGRKAFS